MIRGLLTLACVAIFIGGMLLMRKGWLRRGTEHASEIGALPAVPTGLGEVVSSAVVRYLGSTVAPRWTHRLAFDGLGIRADGDLTRYPEGVLLRRTTGSPIWIPADAIQEEWKVKDRNVIRWAPQSGIEIDTAYHLKGIA